MITASKEINISKTRSDDEDFLEILQHRKQVEFINIASHEMKAPLHTILTFSELLQKDPEKSSAYVEPILRNAKRLQRLSHNLLDLSRIENQSIRLNKESFDLTELISSVSYDMTKGIDGNYHNIVIMRPSKPTFITADKERLTQVVCNLLGNAIKFTANGIISITAEKQIKKNVIVISIKDSGLGINPAIESALFSKFVSTSHDGLGLGLFIAKSIIEAHGGHIWAQNNIDCNGATFSFTLPLF
ncbi:MAG: HAMP domain-containing histidine kinase [Candidatus Nitrosotenuis sp.]|nr:MAG: HAMP domain-containing histidine kinase [Candidatus Nitrosotenuis sp.]